MAGKKGVDRKMFELTKPQVTKFVSDYAKRKEISVSDAHDELLTKGVTRQMSLDAFRPKKAKAKKPAAKPKALAKAKAPAKAKTKAPKVAAGKVVKAPAKKAAAKKASKK